MMAISGVQFCGECREETAYTIQRVSHTKIIKGKEYVFEISEAVCNNCGKPVSLSGLMDSNAQEIDRQYRLLQEMVIDNSPSRRYDIENFISPKPLKRK